MSQTQPTLFVDPSALSQVWVADFLQMLASSWAVSIEDFASDHKQPYLLFEEGYLGIKQGQRKLLYVDWADNKLLQRFAKATYKEPLIQALVSKKNKPEVLFDMTAGMGTDSFIASKFFQKLVMVERHPLVFLMLKDACQRAFEHEKASKFAAKIELVFAEAKDILKNLNEYPKPDVMFFDFMFENKKSLSNKAMETLRILEQQSVNSIMSSQEILELALSNKKIPKIVLKAKKPFNLKRLPQQVFEGKVVNYYQYLNF